MTKTIITRHGANFSIAVLFLILASCGDNESSSIYENKTNTSKLEDWQVCVPSLDTIIEIIDTMAIKAMEGGATVELESALKQALGFIVDLEVGGERKDSINYTLLKENLMSDDFKSKYREFTFCYCNALHGIPESCKSDSVAFYRHKLEVYNNCFKNYQELSTDFCDPKPNVTSVEKDMEPVVRSRKREEIKKKTKRLKVLGHIQLADSGQSLPNVPVQVNGDLIDITNSNGQFLWQKDVPPDTVFSALLSIRETDFHHRYDTLVEYPGQGLNLRILLKERTKYEYRVVNTSASFLQVGETKQAFSVVHRIDLKLTAGKHLFQLLDADGKQLFSLEVELPNQNQKIIIHESGYNLQPIKGHSK